MLRTYKAIINNDRLHWLEERPPHLRHNQEQLVHVTVLDKELLPDKKQNGSLVDFFLKSPLYSSGINLEREEDYGREVKF